MIDGKKIIFFEFKNKIYHNLGVNKIEKNAISFKLFLK